MQNNTTALKTRNFSQGAHDFASLSQHVEYYRKRLKAAYVLILGVALIAMVLASVVAFVLEPYLKTTLPPLQWIEPTDLMVFFVAIIALELSRRNTGVERRISKAALSGDLIQLDKPRWVYMGLGSLRRVGINNGFVLAYTHPDDTEVGVELHVGFDENLVRGDVVFLSNLECQSTHHTTKYWEMKEHDGTVSSGSTTYYHAKLTIPDSNVVFLNTQYNRWIREGDSAVVVVRLTGREGAGYRIKILYLLSSDDLLHAEHR